VIAAEILFLIRLFGKAKKIAAESTTAFSAGTPTKILFLIDNCYLSLPNAN
jgi:hypothetical protein